LARRGFNGSRLFRRLTFVALWLYWRRRAFDLSHLPWYVEEDAIGPVQREEALLLYALVRVLRPAVVVELGFLAGRSALNFLLALPPSSVLYSFDVTPEDERLAATDFSRYRNFKFRRKSQDEIRAADFECLPIDLVLLDASHEVDVNIRTFEALEGLLSDDAIICVHDTGAWSRACFDPTHEQIVAASTPRTGSRPTPTSISPRSASSSTG
jgi:predicted O-methyltransferase YrrM